MTSHFKERSKSCLVIDTIIIFLDLSTSYSIIPYLLFGQYDRYVNLIMMIGINMFYVAIRFYGKFYFPRKDVLFNVYLILNVCNFFSAILTNTGWKSALIYLMLNTMFYLVLYNIYEDYKKRYQIRKSLWLISRGYLLLVGLCLTSCVLMYVLMKMGVNPYVNQINTRFDLFVDNYFNLNSNYYFPYCLSIVNVDTDIRIPFFQDQGFVLGLYHEPTSLTFMVFPAFFLMLYYSQKFVTKLIVFVTFVLILLLAGSTANIGAILVCIVLYLIHELLFINKKNFFKSISIIVLVVLGIILVNSVINMSDLSFIFSKLESGSKDYSQATLIYALTPKTIIGSSFFDLSYINRSNLTIVDNRDVGLINFIMNAVFLLICLYYMLKLFRSKNCYKIFVFLFAAYFFVHSTKVAMLSYSLTMLMYVAFFISHISKLEDNKI